MNNVKKIALISATCLQLFSAISFAADSQFYIFPIKEIEGLKAIEKKNLRPLVDEKAVAFIAGEQNDAQKELLGYFNEQLIKTYGPSIVHVKQVRENFKGPISLVDDDNMDCGSGSTVPMQQAYAAVLGVSRASVYQVNKGSITEILIPVTLNLQIIKPDKAKIIFSTSNTAYTPFLFASSEIDTPAYKNTIKAAMVKNIKSQIDELMNTVKVNFSPKASSVKIVGKEGPFFVVDKGYEIGFKDRDETSAKDADGNEVIFYVVNADDGYSVLKVLAGNVKVGQNYQFYFETKADDSRKPRVMPVTTDDPNKAISNGVIDVFTKSIGFKAPFQLTAVDVNFAQTMDVIRHRAECVAWDKYPNSTTVKDSRTDIPQFLLTVDTGETLTFKQSGKNETKTKETFTTIVQGKVSDLNGVVYGSAIGFDKYVIEKIAGVGLSAENAREISFQNATKVMTEDFLKNINFSPKVFKVKNVASQKDFKGLLVIENLPVEAGFEVTGVIVRNLGIKVGTKDTIVRLPITTDGPVTKQNSDIAVPYQQTDIDQEYYKPKAGDSLVIYALPKGNARNADLCDSEYIGKNNSVTGSFAKPLVSNLILNSAKFQVKEATPKLVSEVNSLLEAAYFKRDLMMKLEAPNAMCLQTGYLIREDLIDCAANDCKASTTNALVVKEIEAGQSKKDYILARKSQLQGFDVSQKDNYWTSPNNVDIFQCPNCCCSN